MSNETTNSNQTAPPVVQGVIMAPCPFCGKAESLRVCNSDESCDEIDSSNIRHYAVVCDAASVAGTGTGGCGAQSGFRPTVDNAIAFWNERAYRIVPPHANYVARDYSGDWLWFDVEPRYVEEFGRYLSDSPWGTWSKGEYGAPVVVKL